MGHHQKEALPTSTGNEGFDDGDVEIAVPEVFKRLVRDVVKTFYSKEAYLIVDLIIHWSEIKEDKLIELLHFDKKVLRSALNDLRKESLIRCKLRQETDEEGKATRHNYYSIAYTNFLAVVKYKLKEMRVRIEAQERAAVRRTNFQCPQCTKMFTDLEVGQLLDIMTGRLLCTYCRSEVTEVTAGDSDQLDARELMTLFNRQLEPIFRLQKECEEAKDEMTTAPNPNESRNQEFNSRMSIPGKMPNQQYSAEVRVSVLPTNKSNQQEVKKPREQPAWMIASIANQNPASNKPNQQETADVEALFGVKLEPDGNGTTVREEPVGDIFDIKGEPWLSEPSPPNSRSRSPNGDMSEDVLKTLLDHEKIGNEPTFEAPASTTTSNPFLDNDNNSESNEQNEEMDEDADEDDDDDFVDVKDEKEEPQEDGEALTEETAMVSVQGQRVPYSKVTDDMVKQMTESERLEYIDIGSQLYSDLYD